MIARSWAMVSSYLASSWRWSATSWRNSSISRARSSRRVVNRSRCICNSSLNVSTTCTIQRPSKRNRKGMAYRILAYRHRRNFVRDGSDCHHHHFQSGICVFSYKNTNFFLYFGVWAIICLATRSVLWPTTCTKCDSGRSSVRTQLGELTTLPQNPLVGWGGDTPPHTRPHSAPLARRCSRLRRLESIDRRAPWH